MMRVLVTGAAGMIGSCLMRELEKSGIEAFGIDRKTKEESKANLFEADLGDYDNLLKIIRDNHIERIIHLAALAHTAGEDDLSYEKYYHVNVSCAKNVFLAAAAESVPVLFISTVDVFGFTYDTVGPKTVPQPVTAYGKTKLLAEKELEEIYRQTGNVYSIYRLSPVYTEEVKRDIQKRYYLKYPDIAYLIGKGSSYEVLDIRKAVSEMVNWCSIPADNDVHIIKDEKMLYTPDCIKAEKNEGRAKHVFKIPAWCVALGYKVLVLFTGKNKYTYLLHKAVKPLRTE